MAGGGGIHRAVEGHDAAEGRDAIGIEGPLQGMGATAAGGHTAGVGVLHHHRRRLEGVTARRLTAVAELAHGGERGLEIQDVVVAELLALQLLAGPQTGGGLGIPGGALVRVLAVAQALAGRQVQLQRGGIAQLGAQPAADGGVVLRRMAEGLQGQLAAQLRADGAGGQRLEEGLVLAGAGEHRHVGMVLGGGAHHGGATNVDVLDRQLPGDIRAGDGFPEGVEVHHHHSDGRDPLGLEIRLMGRIGSLGQDAAMDAGVQGFHPAAQDFRGAGVLRHLGDGQASCRQGCCRTAAGNELVARRQQPLGQGHQPLLVRHAEQGRGRHGSRGGGGESNLRRDAPP